MRAAFLALLTLALEAAASPTPPSPPLTCYLPKHLIALEEHVVLPSLLTEVLASGVIQRSAPGTLEKSQDVGSGRIAAMDAGKLSLTVLSQQSTSGLEDVSGSEEIRKLCSTADGRSGERGERVGACGERVGF
jgi:hypothetical protein